MPEAGSERVGSRHVVFVALRTVLVVVGALLALAAWALASAPGSTPDEDYHLGSIWCPQPLAEHCPTYQANGVTYIEVPEMVGSATANIATLPYASAQPLDSLSQTQLEWASRVNTGGYPGGFYDVMHWFVGPDVLESVVVMRLVNAIIAVALFGTLAVAATPSVRRLMAYVLLPCSVPMAIYLVASINPSGWAITGVTTAAIGLHCLYAADRRWRMITASIASVAGAALAASARSDAGTFLILAVCAVTALNWRRFMARRWVAAIGLVIMVIGVIGFLSGGQVAGTFNADNAAHMSVSAQLWVDAQWLPNLLFAFSGFSAMGNLGWFDTPMPTTTIAAVLAVWFGMCWWGLRHWNPGKALAALGVGGALIVVPMAALLARGDIVGQFVQGRYLVPLIPLFLLVCLVTPNQTSCRSLGRLQSVAAFLLLTGAHTMALAAVIRRYITGTDYTSFHMDWMREWWWPFGPAPMTTWVVGSLGFAAFAAWLLWARTPVTPAEIEPESELTSSESQPSLETRAVAAVSANTSPEPALAAAAAEPVETASAADDHILGARRGAGVVSSSVATESTKPVV